MLFRSKLTLLGSAMLVCSAIAGFALAQDKGDPHGEPPATLCVPGEGASGAHWGNSAGKESWEVVAEVAGGMAHFPKTDEVANGCVPAAIVRGILFLNQRMDDGLRVTDAEVNRAVKDEMGKPVVNGGVGWKVGDGADPRMAVSHMLGAKKRALVKLKLDAEIESEIITLSKAPGPEVFARIADALKEGAVVEAHIYDERSKGAHMTNVGQVLKHNGNMGLRMIDDPYQGTGGAELGARSPRFWGADGKRYGISTSEKVGLGVRVEGYWIYGFIIQRKRKR